MRVDPRSFEARYAGHHRRDPWGFRTDPYEQRRYAWTLAALGKDRYRRAFEPACALGELTRQLARRCDEVVALDPSASALREAAVHTADQPQVHLRQGAIPEDWPDGDFDLIVLSEVGYYFEVPDLRDMVALARGSLVSDGELVAVHWRGHSDDHLLAADEVHDTIAAALGSAPECERHHPGFLCARWVRR